MNGLAGAVFADPKAWAGAGVIVAGALASAFVWTWTRIAAWLQRRSAVIENLQQRVSECEMERAMLRQEVSELRGAVGVLTELLKKEANLG